MQVRYYLFMLETEYLITSTAFFDNVNCSFFDNVNCSFYEEMFFRYSRGVIP